MRVHVIIILLLWSLGSAVPAQSAADPFLGDIQCFGFTFCPRGWAECNGQLLPISSNTALFSLLGTTYGGNGTTNFGLPNLQGKHLLQAGSGPGLTARSQGSSGGSESHTLTAAEMANHTHSISAYPREADKTAAGGNVWGKSGDGSLTYVSAAPPTVPLRADALAPSGVLSPQAVDISQPYLAMRCCIAIQGIFPPRP